MPTISLLLSVYQTLESVPLNLFVNCSYFGVHGGGGIFPASPSPPTNSAAASFLRDKAAVPVEVTNSVAAVGVAEVVQALMAVQVRRQLSESVCGLESVGDMCPLRRLLSQANSFSA